MRTERQARLWTLQQLARLSGIDFSVLSRIETGEREATEEQRDRLAKEFGLTPQYLFPAAYGVQGPDEAVA